MSHKRIAVEIRHFLSHPLANNFILEHYTDTYTKYNDKNFSLILYEKENHENSNTILINIPNQYPFKPPTIHLKNHLRNNFDINYSRWAYNQGENINKIYKKLNLNSYDIFLIWFFIFNKNIYYLNKIPNYSVNPNQECFCCSSVTCAGNWSPAIKLSDVFLEYYLRKQFFNLSKPLGIKYIKNIFNNEKWNLSEDIVEYILQKLF